MEKALIKILPETLQLNLDMNNEHPYYLDLSNTGYWLIKRGSERFTAGYDKEKALDLIKRLNETHRPSVHNVALNEIIVCWNEHEKNEKCNYIREI